MDLRTVKKLGNDLMAEHELSCWSFELDNAKVRFGVCKHRTQTISISRALAKLNTEDIVRDTILHEIAHALVPTGVHHGPIWRAKAQSIGCDGRRTYGDTVVAPTAKYKGTCPNCGRVVEKFRRGRFACSVCCKRHNFGRFDSAYLIEWS